MNNLVPANAVTQNIKTVRDIKSRDLNDLVKLFTGDTGTDLYVTPGDFVIFMGISLRTKDHDVGLRANQWAHAFKTYAAARGEADEPDVVRITYSGITIWNVSWLSVHFDAIRQEVRRKHETEIYW